MLVHGCLDNVGEEVVHEGDVDVADAVAGSEAGLGGGAEAGATCSRSKQLPWMGHSRAGNTSNLNKIQSKN